MNSTWRVSLASAAISVVWGRSTSRVRRSAAGCSLISERMTLVVVLIGFFLLDTHLPRPTKPGTLSEQAGRHAPEGAAQSVDHER
ncbi:hypothetical protein Nans01_40250 [Nocardiopsis ansamitocini]|uniref:Uncharacterized protein n=1 Tax=Nocardiopsis ansamitocini TaxID=1670832 RepID=A0A9W6P9T9_9ACTN|nr:hypothetical protein Nans01_40250 [Nocardiopsis ansamitocini]